MDPNPLPDLDAYARMMADAAVEAFMKVSLVFGCIGLTIICGAVLMARRKSG